MPGATKTRESTKQETRDALLAAGLAEFAEKGLDAPSLDAICARAGYTRGAFYVHFRDRDDFLVAVMEQVFRTFLDAVIATGDAARDLEHTVDRFAGLIAAVLPGTVPATMGIALHKVLDACARSEALRERFVGLLQDGVVRVAAAVRQGQGAKRLRRDADADAIGQLLSLLALGVLTAVDLGMPLDAAGARDAVLALLAPSPAR